MSEPTLKPVHKWKKKRNNIHKNKEKKISPGKHQVGKRTQPSTFLVHQKEASKLIEANYSTPLQLLCEDYESSSMNTKKIYKKINNDYKLNRIESKTTITHRCFFEHIHLRLRTNSFVYLQQHQRLHFNRIFVLPDCRIFHNATSC